MSSHVFHEIYLHLSWHTKDNLRLMTPGLESDIHAKRKPAEARLKESVVGLLTTG